MLIRKRKIAKSFFGLMMAFILSIVCCLSFAFAKESTYEIGAVLAENSDSGIEDSVYYDLYLIAPSASEDNDYFYKFEVNELYGEGELDYSKLTASELSELSNDFVKIATESDTPVAKNISINKSVGDLTAGLYLAVVHGDNEKINLKTIDGARGENTYITEVVISEKYYQFLPEIISVPMYNADGELITSMTGENSVEIKYEYVGNVPTSTPTVVPTKVPDSSSLLDKITGDEFSLFIMIVLIILAIIGLIIASTRKRK